MWSLDPLELLDALEVGVAVDGHGVDELVPGKLPGALGALLTVFLGLLDSHNLAVLEGDKGSDLATVGGGLIKLLVELEKYILFKFFKCLFCEINAQMQMATGLCRLYFQLQSSNICFKANRFLELL